MTTTLNAVVDRRFTAKNFKLESGRTLAEMTLAFETYGRLATDGANAILVTHGYTGGQHAAGAATADSPAGWWDGVIGPGKAIDTDRYFVVSSNMLGSSYGSTGPGSIDPATGKPYGPDFPDITLGDIVDAQKLMLESLGVRHLVAVAGQSFGGFQAFQWAVEPSRLHGRHRGDGVGAEGLGRRGVGHGAPRRARRRPQLERRLALRHGRHPRHAGRRCGWTRSSATGATRSWPARSPDPAAREARMREMAETLGARVRPQRAGRRCARRWSASTPGAELSKIRARVLYVLSRSRRAVPAVDRRRRHGAISSPPASTRPTSSSTATTDTWPAAPTRRSGRPPSGNFSAASAGDARRPS